MHPLAAHFVSSTPQTCRSAVALSSLLSLLFARQDSTFLSYHRWCPSGLLVQAFAQWFCLPLGSLLFIIHLEIPYFRPTLGLRVFLSPPQSPLLSPYTMVGMGFQPYQGLHRLSSLHGYWIWAIYLPEEHSSYFSLSLCLRWLQTFLDQPWLKLWPCPVHHHLCLYLPKAAEECHCGRWCRCQMAQLSHCCFLGLYRYHLHLSRHL